MLRQPASRRALVAGALLGAAALLAGCSNSGNQPNQPITGLRVMAPAKPGGGWDQTARTMQEALQKEKLAAGVQVFNVDGSGGINGLNQLSGARDDKLLMVMGQVMVGAIEQNKSAKTLRDTTPIARVTGENLIIVVPASSSIVNLEQFLTAWQTDPKSLPIATGSAGGADQILTGLVAEQVGIDPGQAVLIANSGGGDALNKLYSGEVKAGVSGINEFAEGVKAGKLRAIAVSGESRSALLPDVKTLKEQGVGIVYTNWRGVVARPGLSDSAKQQLITMVGKLRESAAWKDAVKKNDWQDSYLAGVEFEAFIAEEQEKVKKVLAGLGAVK